MATIEDLRAVLGGHAGELPARPGLLAGVHARLRRDRRRRAVAAGAVAAVVAVTTAGLVLRTDTADDRTVAAPPGVEAFYAGGALLASTAVGPDRPSATFSLTPTSYDLVIRSSCPADDTALVRVRVGGREIGGGSCGGAWSGGLRTEAFWAGFGVVPGRPVAVEVTVAGPDGTATPPGTVHVAAYQRIPVSDYPLPPRPARLTGLEAVPGGSGWDARRAGGGSGTTRTVQITASSALRVVTVAPGAVRVTVSGRLVGLAESWDWNSNSFELGLNAATLRESGIRIEDGEGIDVTVTAERFTVPGWTVEVR